MFKIWMVAGVFTLLNSQAATGCGGTQSIRPSDQVAENSAKLLAKRDFQGLDRLVADYRRPHSLAADGQANLVGMYEGLSKSQSACDDVKESDEAWLAQRALLVEWSLASPKSTAPLLALASFDHAYGWQARGSGYAATVTDEGFALMRERVEHARQALEKMPPAARLDPQWYGLMLHVGLSQGWPEDGFNDLFNQAIQLFPEYVDFYYTKATYYSPQWHGSTEQLVAYMNEVSQTKHHISPGLYARMYRFVDRAAKVNFNNGTVSYPKLKESYEYLLREFPTDWIRNPYARYACIAGDWPVVRTQLRLIGEHTTDTVWNPAFYQYCQTTAEKYVPVAAQ